MKKEIYPTNILQSVLITFIFLLTLIIIVGISALFNPLLDNNYILTIAKIIAYPLGTFLVYKFVSKKSNFKGFNFPIPNLMILLLVSLISVLSVLVLSLPLDYMFINSFKSSFIGESFALNKVIGELILSPITEELVFRAIILNGLLTKFKPWKAILISSLLFGVPHFSPIHHGYMFNAIFFGILAGWVYYKTDNIIYSIIMHSLYNLSIQVATYFFNNYNSEVFTKESYFLYGENSIGILSILSLLFISTIYLTYRLNKKWFETNYN